MINKPIKLKCLTINQYRRSFLEFSSYLLLIVLLLICFIQNANSQEYIQAAGVIGSPDADYTRDYLVENDTLYIAGGTSGNFPATNGTAYSGGKQDFVFVKYEGNTLNLISSSVYGGSESETPHTIEKIGNYIYVFGTAGGPGIPASNAHAGGNDVFIAQMDLNGNLLNARFYGGSANEQIGDIEIVNGTIHLALQTQSNNFPTTDGSTPFGSSDVIYAKVDVATLSMSYASYLGGSIDDSSPKITIEGPLGAIVFYTASPDLPVTNSSVLSGQSDVAVYTFVSATGSILDVTYLGGSGGERLDQVLMNQGEVFVTGNTSSTDFPNTSGGPMPTTNNMFFTRLSINLGIVSSSFVTAGYSLFNNLTWHHNAFYLIVHDLSFSTNGAGVYALKIDRDGNVIWNYQGISTGSKYADLTIDNEKVFVTANATEPGLVTTNGSYHSGNFDIYHTILDTNGVLMFAGYYGGPESDLFSNDYYDDGGLIIDGSKTYLCGNGGNGFPTTNGTAGNNTLNGADIAAMVIERCPTDYVGSPATNPSSQSVCRNGLITEINVDPYIVPGSTLPVLTSNGATYSQPDIHANYQWQEATSSSGPWTDIPGANNENYTPPPLITTKCYRRLARNGKCCGNMIIQTSDVHCITVGPDQAPVVDAGGIYNTCPGTPVTMGVNVSSGTPPYNYQWTQGNNPTVLSTNPTLTVSPTFIGATVYTILVTDARGCRQLDQAIVNSYSANAGADVGFCEGTAGAVIGGPPVPGLPGVGYSWSPAIGLSCTTCAQPTATPNFVTTYTLTLTIPVTGGGTCVTNDQVTVTPTNRPVNNFAGPDRVICFGNTTTIGLAAEPGFAYTWAPGAYISSNITTPTTFDHGNLQFPNPNPVNYQLTAEKNGCTWFDKVEVAVIKAKAYPGNLDPACGPRYVGEGDFTPNINETWQWTQLSGDGMFTGPTNIPVTTVSASVNVTSQYQLSVSYNGTTCTDVATVPVCGTGPGGPGCEVEIYVGGDIGCPSYGIYGEVWLIAYGGIGGAPGPYNYSWSPAAGLNTTTGDSVMLTDNVPRTYTVTISHPLSNLTCIETISVNNPAWSKPDFTAQDPIICPGQSVNIGDSPVAGYAYEWSPITNLSNPFISNPVASGINSTTHYYASVVDINSGCTTLDTATVSVIPTIAIAGPDQVVCDNSVFTIGAAPAPNTTYSWTPAGANWQNGTDQFSSQPQVLVAITTTFIVTATNNTTGCFDKDTVVLSIGSPITPFTLQNVQYCPSSPSIQLGGGVPFGYSYSWSPSTNMNNPNIQTPSVSPPPNTQTTYTLVVTNQTGCSFAVTQTVVPRVPTPMVAPTQVLCVGETANIGSNSNPAGYTYSWSPAIGLSNPNSPNPVFTATATGTYVYTLTMSQFGCSNTADVLINVVDFTLNLPPKTVCTGGCVRIGTAPVIGATYNWSPSTGLDDPTSSNPLACVSVNTTYTLTAVGPNGCQEIVTVPVYTNPNPAPTVVIPTLNACIGTTGNVLFPNVSPPGNYNYNWAPNNGTLIYPNSPAPEVVITGLGTYTYDVTVTNAASGCASEASVDVVVTACDDQCNLQVSIAGSNLQCYNDNSGSINLTVSNSSVPNTYNWSNGAVVEDPAGLSAGVYSVTITDADGCVEMATVTLTEPTDLICATSVLSDVTVSGGSDGSALATGNGGTPGYTYQWSDGQSTTTATGLMAGTYTVSIYDNNNCLEVCTVTITEPAPPCPDLTPTITILPGNISGNSPLEVAVEVSELNDVDTDGTIITVRMPSDPRLLFVWNIGLTQAAFIPVQNPDWNYLGDNGIFHSWTYNGPGLIIFGQTTSAFGFQAFYDPQSTDGQTTITATIVPFSGGECNVINNTDAEQLIYFD